MSEKMEKRLRKEVDRMRNQVMSFTNDGAEFQLNVPDTNEVKENLAELGELIVPLIVLVSGKYLELTEIYLPKTPLSSPCY